MSKKFLKVQAEELLGSELRQVKGGTVPIIDDCSACSPGCASSCQPGCNKKA